MAFGVHSEVGNLRRVMVHRPGLEHSRLTPSNAGELLFDDVLWVARAKAEHDMFAEAMRDRGVEVFEAGDLLARALAKPEAREWVWSRWSPAWWWPMSGIPGRTPRCARPASR